MLSRSIVRNRITSNTLYSCLIFFFKQSYSQIPSLSPDIICQLITLLWGRICCALHLTRCIDCWVLNVQFGSRMCVCVCVLEGIDCVSGSMVSARRGVSVSRAAFWPTPQSNGTASVWSPEQNQGLYQNTHTDTHQHTQLFCGLLHVVFCWLFNERLFYYQDLMQCIVFFFFFKSVTTEDIRLVDGTRNFSKKEPEHPNTPSSPLRGEAIGLMSSKQ